MSAIRQRNRGIVAVAWLLVMGCGGSPDAHPTPEPLSPTASALLEQAREAYDRGDFGSALALIDSTARFAPARAEVFFLKGLVLRDVHRYEEAHQALEQVLTLNPSYRSVPYNLGQNAFLQAAYRTALRWYREEERILRRADGRASAGEAQQTALAVVLAQMGRSYAQLGVADSARMAYNAALEADSTNASAHAWLAEIDRDVGTFDAALTHARRSMEIDPNNTDYYVLWGTTLLRSGRAEEAMPPLMEAARRQPWNREATYNLGRALVLLGRHEEASPYLARADTLEILWRELALAQRGIDLYPRDAARWEEYAFLLNQIGHRSEAWKAYTTARALRTNPPSATPTDDSGS